MGIRAIIVGCLSLAALASGASTTTTTTYQYDELGRVTSVNYNNAATNAYSYDAADNRVQKQATLTGDTTPPSAPGAVTFSGLGATSVTAAWAAATDNVGVTGYQFSLNSGTSWTSVGLATSVNVTALSAGTAYTFSVRATDAVGNIGPASSASFTTIAAVTISNLTVQTQYTGAVASYSLSSSGGIVTTLASSSGTTNAGNWLSPQVGMSGFQALATLTSGTCNGGGPMGTWTSLSSTLTWTVDAPGGGPGSALSCTFTLTIRNTTNTSITGSATITVVAVNAP